jgi:starch phosphorylase
LRASWNHSSEQVWRALDPVLWDLTHNPWAVLRTASREHIEKLLADPEFRGRVDAIERAKREALRSRPGFSRRMRRRR